jgi:hypothetical protein
MEQSELPTTTPSSASAPLHPAVSGVPAYNSEGDCQCPVCGKWVRYIIDHMNKKGPHKITVTGKQLPSWIAAWKILCDRLNLPDRPQLALNLHRALKKFPNLRTMSVEILSSIENLDQIRDEILNPQPEAVYTNSFLSHALKIEDQPAMWDLIFDHYPSDMPRHNILMNLLFDPDDELLSKMAKMGGGGGN